MATYAPHPLWAKSVYLSWLLVTAAAAPALGQEVVGPGSDLWREPAVDKVVFPPPGSGSGGTAAPASRVARLRLFRMFPGFLNDPPGLESGDDPADLSPPSGSSSADSSGFQVAMGPDNPFFDYRWRNDPGGVGYYRLHSQVQLVDVGKTCLCLGLQAVTPAGIAAGGLENGPTVFSPAVAWFQELGEGAALQGFVSKNIRAQAGWTDDLESSIHYGVALQYALPGLSFSPGHSIHVFVEALGRYRYEGETGPNRSVTWEVIPGLHWRVGERWWMSVGAARTHILTCSWQF
jgi:hypothetical protein